MAFQTARTSAREIAFDRLPEAGASLEVLLLDNVTFTRTTSAGRSVRTATTTHELIWTREGAAEHLIDGEVSLVEPNEITLIGRSQVHVFERARGLKGAVLRFGEELLHGDAVASANPSWLAGRSPSGRALSRSRQDQSPAEHGSLRRLRALLGYRAAVEEETHS